MLPATTPRRRTNKKALARAALVLAKVGVDKAEAGPMPTDLIVVSPVRNVDAADHLPDRVAVVLVLVKVADKVAVVPMRAKADVDKVAGVPMRAKADVDKVAVVLALVKVADKVAVVPMRAKADADKAMLNAAKNVADLCDHRDKAAQMPIKRVGKDKVAVPKVNADKVKMARVNVVNAPAVVRVDAEVAAVVQVNSHQEPYPKKQKSAHPEIIPVAKMR